MFRNKVVVWSVVILASIVTLSLCDSTTPTAINTREYEKLAEGVHVTLDTTLDFYEIFLQCLDSPMPSKKFALEDLKTFVNSPLRTTVGTAPRFTSNRKFFANLLRSPAFKLMLEKDERQLRQNLVDKMKFCKEVVMDGNLLELMYDREVDLTKL